MKHHICFFIKKPDDLTWKNNTLSISVNGQEKTFLIATFIHDYYQFLKQNKIIPIYFSSLLVKKGEHLIPQYDIVKKGLTVHHYAPFHDKLPFELDKRIDKKIVEQVVNYFSGFVI